MSCKSYHRAAAGYESKIFVVIVVWSEMDFLGTLICHYVKSGKGLWYLWLQCISLDKRGYMSWETQFCSSATYAAQKSIRESGIWLKSYRMYGQRDKNFNFLNSKPKWAQETSVAITWKLKWKFCLQAASPVPFRRGENSENNSLVYGNKLLYVLYSSQVIVAR